MTAPMDEPRYTQREINAVAYALSQVPFTSELEFPAGGPPKVPTPSHLVDWLNQLTGILSERLVADEESEEES